MTEQAGTGVSIVQQTADEVMRVRAVGPQRRNDEAKTGACYTHPNEALLKFTTICSDHPAAKFNSKAI